ncbi:MAG: hypothetical protein M1821_005811 [Bathelium mastoideum]|nr:MAG: hypothetical protein M1821_005811 [Bathelium mastoideum]
MAIHQIIIANKSRTVQSFSLFTEVPEISGSSEDLDLYSNAYATGRPIRASVVLLDGPEQRPDFQQFAVTTETYAICGSDEIRKGAIIYGTDTVSTNVDVANCIVAQGGPGFTTSTGGAGGPESQFHINISPYNSRIFSRVWVGYGKPGPIGALYAEVGNNSTGRNVNEIRGIRVCASWPAVPTEAYNVKPRNAFYVTTGTYATGQAVDLADIDELNKVKIDFTGRQDKIYAYVVYNGTFSDPEYTVRPPEVLTTPPSPPSPPPPPMRKAILRFEGHDLEPGLYAVDVETDDTSKELLN